MLNRPSDPAYQRGLFVTSDVEALAVPATGPAGATAQAAAEAEAASAQEQRQLLALEIGEEPERIRILQPDWQALTRRVVVVDLTVGFYRARHRLTLDDLGLTEAQRQDPEYAAALREVFSLGNKKLLPELFGQAEEIERQARYSVDRVSLRSGFANLVPRPVYPELRERLERLRDDFFGLRDLIEAGYDELPPQILERFRRLGRGALAHLKASGAAVDDEEGCAEAYAQRHLALLPPREAIAGSFTFAWTPSYLAPSAEVIEDQALAEKRRLEAQIEADVLRLKAKNIRYQEDFDYQQKRLELEAARRDREREEQLAWEIQRVRRQKQLELVDGTFKDISCQLREAVYEVCLDVLRSLQEKGRVVRNSSKQLNGLVQRRRLLNVCDDQEIEAIAKQMEAIVQSNSKRRNTKAIGEVLTEIGALARGQLLAAGRTPRSGLALDIPDVIDQSRRSTAARRVSAILPPASFELTAVRRGRRLAASSDPLPVSA